ncbi:MAG: MaoC/PaaZ C-terminal domain-containing protein [Hyphomonadaceae bacterium]
MIKLESIRTLRENDDIPDYHHIITELDLVKYCGAADDYSAPHWDHVYMVEHGFTGVIVHGWFTFAVMCRAVTNLASPEICDISRYAVRYRRPTLPGALCCGGKVVRVRDEEGRAAVDLDLWAKDAAGNVTTTATMTLLAALA